MGRKIKRIRTDNAAEFCANYFESYLKSQGIKSEKTNVYSPEMNGVAERYNRTIIEGARALLIEAKLPKQLWAEVVFTQNYLRNRFPHKTLNGKAPLNIWFGKCFSVRHLKIIGSIAYVFIPK
jgi:transposase InsO family protein